MTNANAMPEGYKSVTGGDLPPFLGLSIGQACHGTLEKVRVTKKIAERTITDPKTKKRSKVPVEVEKYYFDLKLVDTCEGDDGSKDHNPVEKKPGDMVTLSASSNLLFGFRIAACNEMGVQKVKGEDWPEIDWSILYSKKVFIRREKDGTVEGGEFDGNKKLKYTVAFNSLKERVAA